jgi:hypothetical protein
MAARGTIAKENIVKVLMKAFGDNFIGEVDKKYYVAVDDGGSLEQIAITLTCPKNPVAKPPSVYVVKETAKGLDFEDNTVTVEPPKTEITEQEKKNIADLMARLGL